jgi:hypothetical protein
MKKSGEKEYDEKKMKIKIIKIKSLTFRLNIMEKKCVCLFF